MIQKTSGQLEAQITEAMIKFELEYMGRGPNRSRTFLLDDMIIVRLEGVLTPAEQQLAKDPHGVKLLKEVRTNLIENAREVLAALIHEITGRKVFAMHSDISARAGERVVVFVLQPRE